MMVLVAALAGCATEGFTPDGDVELQVDIRPVEGDVGAFFAGTVPMELTLDSYRGPASELRPYDGFVFTEVEAEVECVNEVLLDLRTSDVGFSVFFMEAEGGGDVLAGGGDLESGGTSSRESGEAIHTVDLDFSCLAEPIPHRVELTWASDAAGR